MTLARFIASLVFRSPAKRTELQSAFEDIDSQIKGLIQGQLLHQVGDAEGARRFDEWNSKPFHERYGEPNPTEIGQVTNKLLGELQGFANLLRAAPWRIGRALGTRELYISDNPVSAYWPPTNVSWWPRAFADYEYYLALSPNVLLKIGRRRGSAAPVTPASLEGQRVCRDFKPWEVSLARHIVTSQASRFLYGAARHVDRTCATTCLENIDRDVRQWVSANLGPEPLPPWQSGLALLP